MTRTTGPRRSPAIPADRSGDAAAERDAAAADRDLASDLRNAAAQVASIVLDTARDRRCAAAERAQALIEREQVDIRVGTDITAGRAVPVAGYPPADQVARRIATSRERIDQTRRALEQIDRKLTAAAPRPDPAPA